MPLIHDPGLWKRRQAEKEASRMKDAADIASGKRSAEEVQRENSVFNPKAVRKLKLDLSPCARRWY